MSGSGKSSLLASLYQQGYELISDDISNLKLIEDKPVVFPCFPRVMLWNDTIRKLNFETGKGYKLRSDMEKYLFPINPDSFYKPVELAKIIILTGAKKREGNSIIKGLSKIERLSENLFKPWMSKNFWTDQNTFHHLTTLGSLIRVEEFTNDKTLSIELLRDAFIEKVLNDVK